MNGATNAAGRAVDVHGDVEAGLLLELVERVADLLDRLVGAVERRAEDRDDADRVLVAELHGLLGGEIEAVPLHRDEAHLDVPVVRELLPADLDVDAHDDVRLVGRLALGRAALLPAALEREAAEHGRLARPGRRAAGRLVGVGRVPQPAEDVDAAHLELRGLRVLVLVDHVLVEALGHELLGLRLHPRGDERGQVQARVAVEHQLVVDDLVGDVGRQLALGDLVARDVPALEREQRRDGQVFLLFLLCLRVLQRHGGLPSSGSSAILADRAYIPHVNFFVAADAYDRFMGRYSVLLAPGFADFGGVAAGQRVLDVGCGPGALTTELVERLGPEAVAAVDPSEPFVVAARERHPGVDVQQAPAEQLPFEGDAFDAALAQLVVHFMSDPAAGVLEMARVTRAGGVVAACVWDHGSGQGPLSLFWEAARELDPGTADESQMAGAHEGDLTKLFEGAGLREIKETALPVSLEHSSFDEWWEPYTMGVGPVGVYAAGLEPERLAELRALCREKLPEAPFTLTSRAWSARGRA